MLKLIHSSYAGAAQIVRQYWRVYGGMKALLSSPYLHLSGLLAIAMWGSWSSSDWWSHPLSVLPNLVGFSVAAFAIFLTVGGEEFQKVIAGVEAETEGASPYLEAAAAFSHFIVVQVLALIGGLLLAACYRIALPDWVPEDFVPIHNAIRGAAWFTGYWLFLYALVLTFGTVMVIFRSARWFDLYQTSNRNETSPK